MNIPEIFNMQLPDLVALANVCGVSVSADSHLMFQYIGFTCTQNSQFVTVSFIGYINFTLYIATHYSELRFN